jgi:predicted transcriptional regulator
MKKIYLILSLIFIFCLDNKSYAIENGSFVSDLTIKELSENVEKLKEEKNEFQEKNKELAKEYGDLVSFIKKDLTDDEILEIKGKVEIFMQERK